MVEGSPNDDAVEIDNAGAHSSTDFSQHGAASVTSTIGSQTGRQEQPQANDPFNTIVPQPNALSSTTIEVPTGEGGVEFSASFLNTPTDLELMNIGLNTYDQAWLLGSDFDLDALNYSISAAISAWELPSHEVAPDHQGVGEITHHSSRESGSGTLTQLVPAVQNNWHTTLSRDVISHGSTDQDEIDEAYREGLSHRLQPPLSNTPLPSADFLNLCIKLYFVRFNPVFPLLHAPSFRPSSENALLLLSVCSVGALFMGSASAATQGRKIFQMLNKAILASWDGYIRQGSREVLSLVQAATIGQTFGMLSGQPSDLCLTESFHGTVIAWARQGGFFKIKEPLAVLADELGTPQEDTWKTWAHAEESVRLILGLYVHDSEFATTFHHEPLLRYRLNSLPFCSSDDVFFAANPSEWHSLLEKEREGDSTTAQSRPFASGTTTPTSMIRNSHMYKYASLSGIVASIQETRSQSLDHVLVDSFRNMLLTWHSEHSKHGQGSKNNHLSLMIFWHLAFMALYADFDLLERSIGRDGRVVAEQARRETNDWAASSEARYGVLHSLLLLKYLEMLPIGFEPAIHVPKAVFYSAIVVYSYIRLKPTAGAYTPSQAEVNVPELQISGSSGPANLSSDRTSSDIFSPVEPSVLCSAIDILRRIGHWEISRKFASILETLLDDLTTAP